MMCCVRDQGEDSCNQAVYVWVVVALVVSEQPRCSFRIVARFENVVNDTARYCHSGKQKQIEETLGGLETISIKENI